MSLNKIFDAQLLRLRINGWAPFLNGRISLRHHIQDGHLSKKCCLGALDIGSKERFRGPQNVYRVLSQGLDYIRCGCYEMMYPHFSQVFLVAN